MGKKDVTEEAPVAHRAKIHSTVRHGGSLYLRDNDGHAEALAKTDLHPESVKRLLDTGAVSGSLFEEIAAKVAETDAADKKSSAAQVGSNLPAGMPGRLVLVNAGIDTLDKVRAMSDEQLLAVKGIGAETLKVVRDATA